MLQEGGSAAPCVLDGSGNGHASAWVEQMLAPELRPADIVMVDSLGSHGVECANCDRRRLALPADAQMDQAQGLLMLSFPSSQRN